MALCLELAASVGLSAERYVGINVNVLVASLASVLSLQMLRATSHYSPSKGHALLVMFAFCPMIWLSASIHVRDAFVMLLVAVNYYVLLRFIARRTSILWLSAAIGATLLFPFIFQFLRRELYFAPLALSVTAIVSMTLFRGYGKGGYFRYFVLLLPLFFILLSVGAFEMMGADSISKGREDYAGKAVATGVDSSLGYKLVVDQPIYIRPLVGSLYLFLMPIPLWAGLSAGTAYMTFKSLFAVFSYIFLPYLSVAVGGLREFDEIERTSFVFLLGSAGAFVVAVALSSLESRHIIPFLPPAFVACAMTAEFVASRRRQVRKFTQLLAVLMITAHAAWSMLKG